MSKTWFTVLFVGVLLLLVAVLGVQAQGPAPAPPSVEGEISASDDTVNFQGRLYDSTGLPVAPGNYNMQFSICADSGCGTVVWGPNEFTAAVDAEGLFNVLLSGLNASHFTADRWLRIRVCNTANQSPCSSGWDDMTPYQPMTSVAIAIGNIRKNVVDTSTASSTGYILTITNSGSGGGLYGVSNSGTGVRGNGWYGLYGYSGSGGYGVYGTGTSNVWGVYGYSPDSYGVYGSSSSSLGVRGSSTSSIGVYGTSSSNTGVYGYSSSARGVMGYSPSTTTDVDAVTGVAATSSYYRPPTGVSAGVVGSVATAGDYGIFGINSSTTGDTYGIIGVAAGTSFSLPPVGSSAGVVGSVGTSSDYGVFGDNSYAGNGYGVVGIANSTSVETPLSGSVGVVARGYYGVYASTTDSVLGWAGYFNGDIYATNYWLGSGAGEGTPALALVGSPENWVEDLGRGTLVEGKAVMEIEPLFAQTVNLAEEYHVFLTPLGDCNGLYVSRMTPTSFEVRELNGGTSSISFDYRIVAKRQGYEGMRMNRLSTQVKQITIHRVEAQSQQVQVPAEGIKPR